VQGEKEEGDIQVDLRRAFSVVGKGVGRGEKGGAKYRVDRIASFEFWYT